MSEYVSVLEIVPWQHGAEDPPYHCWAWVWDHACMRRASDTANLWTGMHLCRQHETQLRSRGVEILHVVRQPKAVLKSLLEAAEADPDWERPAVSVSS